MVRVHYGLLYDHPSPRTDGMLLAGLGDIYMRQEHRSRVRSPGTYDGTLLTPERK